MSPTERLLARLAIREESDVVMARKAARNFALALGVAPARAEALVLAVSEVTRNVVLHAEHGELALHELRSGALCGIEVLARDEGPGIADLELAMVDGYSTAAGLGLGLASARRLVDEFEIKSTLGGGTLVRLRTWAPSAARGWQP